MASVMTPREIVDELDKHIIGQAAAKRSVAIALRNRHRRMKIDEPLRGEITPKNILMIGPTGVGKTEIARRLAKLAKAPFIKVEATKFTEIGYVGRDVESIIRDLAEVGFKMTREEAMHKVRDRAAVAARERLLNTLMQFKHDAHLEDNPNKPLTEKKINSTRSELAVQFDKGELDDKDLELEIATNFGVEIMAPPGMEEMTSQLQNLFQNMSGGKTKVRKMKVKDAFKNLCDEESSKLLNDDEIKLLAIEKIEQHGIVFIDEIDKITQRSHGGSGGEVSREGVQRDLLPLIEGSTVSTKHGMIRTDHILFITSGAFHMSKPSDLIPELQGRLPIRVELSSLTAEDFIQILTEPSSSLTKQYAALLATEGVKVTFTKNGIKKIAELAFKINSTRENIGARRLHTVMEKLLEDISFDASEKNGEAISIDEKYVENKLNALVSNEDLSHFIL